ncbi:dienelactone hydrolase family protein [Halobacteriovorax sp. GB3]|uniref:dienelactone hydrolase family protein n=1 Tax=Halobacteriovorax sp. GB3 TaxID=2719615 RepID=UPI00235F2068|nr:dienelactone hydrolase family protein [Halobacteriovorax sp. GB3]MDD0854868.1 dienelactone hydrolase family protein [Halobacteriovorax sp. GB3]
MRIIILSVLAMFLSSCSTSDKRHQDLNYEVDGTSYKAYIAKPKKENDKKVGIIVVHEWWGHNEYARKRADKLAELGYTALALDMYGEGKVANHPKEAGAFAGAVFKDLNSAKKRFKKAIETLKENSTINPDNISAIGYCFGGGIVLNMARLGLDLDAVVSFHGSLGSPIKTKPGMIKSKVLVLNGKADPMVKKKDIKNFMKEMKKAKVEYKFFNYENAKHAFTNPMATELGKKYGLPLAYDKDADEKSWEQMKMLFDELY